MRSIHGGTVGVATPTIPDGEQPSPRKSKPLLRRMKVWLGCCGMSNSANIRFTHRPAARRFRRPGASTIQSSMKRAEDTPASAFRLSSGFRWNASISGGRGQLCAIRCLTSVCRPPSSIVRRRHTVRLPAQGGLSCFATRLSLGKQFPFTQSRIKTLNVLPAPARWSRMMRASAGMGFSGLTGVEVIASQFRRCYCRCNHASPRRGLA